ncbi:hypothetical protein ABZW18_00750 [Streptomyces sp. NPDC004647]|uniref:WD40/YVTN/BNR-like repeat-containing protein n=1 Tax=Streptomyces sp. NPDC004647 TaxID=3154671 RepID=UPI00339ECB7F
MWATTRDGLLHSTDGGTTFQPVPGAPALASVERPAPNQLIALAADGKVLSGSDGKSWTEHGRLPQGAQPAVLTAATPTHLLAADTNDAVYESKDGRRTWTTVHRPGHTNTGHFPESATKQNGQQPPFRVLSASGYAASAPGREAGDAACPAADVQHLIGFRDGRSLQEGARGGLRGVAAQQLLAGHRPTQRGRTALTAA